MLGWPGPITHRQFLAWEDWDFREHWKRKDRTTYYLWQILVELRRSWIAEPGKVDSHDMDLFPEEDADRPAREGQDAEPAETVGADRKAAREEYERHQVALAKGTWLMCVGYREPGAEKSAEAAGGA